MVACSSEHNDSKALSEGIQQESNSDAQSSEPQSEKEDTEETEPEQPSVEFEKVDLFIEEYNKAATITYSVHHIQLKQRQLDLHQ